MGLRHNVIDQFSSNAVMSDSQWAHAFPFSNLAWGRTVLSRAHTLSLLSVCTISCTVTSAKLVSSCRLHLAWYYGCVHVLQHFLYSVSGCMLDLHFPTAPFLSFIAVPSFPFPTAPFPTYAETLGGLHSESHDAREFAVLHTNAT